MLASFSRYDTLIAWNLGINPSFCSSTMADFPLSVSRVEEIASVSRVGGLGLQDGMTYGSVRSHDEGRVWLWHCRWWGGCLDGHQRFGG